MENNPSSNAGRVAEARASLRLLIIVLSLVAFSGHALAAATINANPLSGIVGSTVTISGSGMVAGQAVSVTYDGSVPSSLSACNTDSGGTLAGCTFQVPASSSGVTHTILVSDGTNSRTFSFTVTPYISLSALYGPAGSTITVYGSGYRSLAAIAISFDGTPQATTPAALLADASGSFIATFMVPLGASPSPPAPPHTVTATDLPFPDTASQSFSVTNFAATISLSPPAGQTGSSVTISGSNFDPSTTVTATFSGSGSLPLSGSCTTDSTGNLAGCTFTVPSGATIGNHNVVVSEGGKNPQATYVVVVPTTPPPPPAAPPACDISTLFNTNNGWLSVNMLVVLASVMVGGLIFALSNLLPPVRGERLRRITRFEIFEAFLSVIIIVALFSLSALTCNTGALLTGQSSYTNLFTLADQYMGTLLFTNGLSIVGNLYQRSVDFTITSNVFLIVSSQLGALSSAALGSLTLFKIFSISPGPLSYQVFRAYSDILTNLYGGLMLVAFAPLLILYLAIPIIQAGSLAVVVPVSLVMRSFSFLGPKLREASNLFLALAVGFYFILPLTITFNLYVASCLKIGLVSSFVASSTCTGYPLAQYLVGQSLPTTPAFLFTQQGATLATSSVVSSAVSSAVPFGVTSVDLFNAYSGQPWISTVYGQEAQTIWNTFWNAPQIASDTGATIALYLFLSIVLLSIDLAITVGFINGLGKGLNSLSEIFGIEPLFGD